MVRDNLHQLVVLRFQPLYRVHHHTLQLTQMITLWKGQFHRTSIAIYHQLGVATVDSGLAPVTRTTASDCGIE